MPSTTVTKVDPKDVAAVEALEPKVHALMELIEATMPAIGRLIDAGYPGASYVADQVGGTIAGHTDGDLMVAAEALERFRCAQGSEVAYDHYYYCIQRGLTVAEATHRITEAPASEKDLDRAEALRKYAEAAARLPFVRQGDVRERL